MRHRITSFRLLKLDYGVHCSALHISQGESFAAWKQGLKFLFFGAIMFVCVAPRVCGAFLLPGASVASNAAVLSGGFEQSVSPQLVFGQSPSRQPSFRQPSCRL
jgi:hypothetical protein